MAILYRFIVSLIISISFSGFAYAMNQECSVEDFFKIYNLDTKGFKETRVPIVNESSQGGEAIIFENEKSQKIIKSTIAGETGQIKINYFFKEKDEENFLVDFKEYRYTDSIYKTESKVSSISINKFVVCEGNIHLELNKVVEKSKKILNKIIDNSHMNSCSLLVSQIVSSQDLENFNADEFVLTIKKIKTKCPYLKQCLKLNKSYDKCHLYFNNFVKVAENEIQLNNEKWFKILTLLKSISFTDGELSEILSDVYKKILPYEIAFLDEMISKYYVNENDFLRMFGMGYGMSVEDVCLQLMEAKAELYYVEVFNKSRFERALKSTESSYGC